MRGLQTPVQEVRKKVFVEVAKIAMTAEGPDIADAIEEIPYTISPTEEPRFRESVYRERAICSERVRLAMGLSLRPQNHPVHITAGFNKSTVDSVYYEAPLMQVIPSACNACEDNVYEVSNLCEGCMSHQCIEVCPVGAISHVGNHSVIDKDKCIKCGKCKSVCPYGAIGKKIRPCSNACGVKAIGSDEYGRAAIDPQKCLSCGMCMVNCPFGAIADKSQFFQLLRCLKHGGEVYAEIAPAYLGQFGKNVGSENIKAALMKLGFKDVIEVAHGADIGCISEAKKYVKDVIPGNSPFLLTSCCPSWAMLIKTQFPEIADNISSELTPMVATARGIKKKHPDGKVVFIGPCAAKKLEAMRRTVRSDVDFVITFEELDAIFEAMGIDPANECDEESLHDATAAGRGYAVAGGVSGAIEKCVKEYFPGNEVKIVHTEGLDECRKTLLVAKAGRYNGYLIEGMGCPGGCIAGAGTVIPIAQAKKNIENIVAESSKKLPPLDITDELL